MIIKQPPRLTNRSSVIKYIEADLWSWLKEVTVGILKINFQDNFISFVAQDVKILAGQEIGIPNQFKNRYPGVIPGGRVIIRQQGDANIIDGASAWTADLLFMRNPSANDVTVSILFFK